MRRMLRALLLLSTCLWLAAGTASALEAYVSGAYAGMEMEEFNDTVRAANSETESTADGLRAIGFDVATDPLDPVQEGLAWEAGLSARLLLFDLGIAWRGLNPKVSEGDMTVGGKDVLLSESTSGTHTVREYHSGERSEVSRFTFASTGPALSVALPLTAGRTAVRLVGRATRQNLSLINVTEERSHLTRRVEDYNWSTGKTQTSTQRIEDRDVSTSTYRGNATGYGGGIEFTSPLASFLSLTGHLGYESLVVPEVVNESGEGKEGTNGEPMEVDLSGMRAGVALALAF